MTEEDMQNSPAWYDAQYNNRARVPEHPAILAHWAESSARAYERPGWALDLPYGSGAAERLDLLPAARKDAPVLVYIHGGYWRALSKRDQGFIAPPFADAGAMVVLLDYDLCPAVTVEHIALQMVKALTWVHANAAAHGGDPGHIVVAGHSAGGHLATMLLACDWPAFAPGLPPDLVKAALSISGLHDLEPLRHAPFLSADINLSAESALRLSPAAMRAPAHGALATVVGGDESEEFHRQADLIAQAWAPRMVADERVPGRNHMDVLHELVDTQSRTHALALELLGLR
ncbi:alpha/beta hydrolase [Variovorax sp. KK3]|uniref:alpha/beta hydrolase n=1 Tax=Variovorax sp. KK3 TaxID=1855728 RepID=UPI00097C0459|nr:alpha/beta hydrolase [Variovorax sp. KK3]